jgi:hypothetical protein
MRSLIATLAVTVSVLLAPPAAAATEGATPAARAKYTSEHVLA